MQAIQNLSLAALRFGHDFPGASINARQAGRLDGIEQLAASIKEEGVLNSLHAFQDPEAVKKGVYYVDDGNRRLAALQLLVKQKVIAKDALIPMLVWTGDNSKEALRKSAQAAAHSVPVHPVDQFEAFADIIESEKATPEKIAARYALPLKIVKQRLALGGLSPVIRKAWRDGKINAEAAEAYASSPHHSAQEKLWKRGTWEAKQPHQIRRLLMGDTNELEKLLKFVGEEAYKKAGGKLVEDLFGDKEGKSYADFGLLQRLAGEKLKAKATELVKDGWGWAAAADDLPSEAEYHWPRKASPKPDEKKKLGVILDVGDGGGMTIKTGVIKPGVKGVKADNGRSAPKAPKKKKAGQLSDSLAQRLSETLSFAASAAMTHDQPEMSLAVALAGLTSTDGPINLAEKGLGTILHDRHAMSGGRGHFEKQLPIFLKLSLKEKLSALAGIVGKSIDFQTHSSERLPLGDKSILAVIAKMDGKRLNAEILSLFKAEDYFASVSGELRLQAVREMNPAHEPLVAKMKKAAQIKACVGCFTLSKSWLPPELRTVHYTGPALKATKKKPAKGRR